MPPIIFDAKLFRDWESAVGASEKNPELLPGAEPLKTELQATLTTARSRRLAQLLKISDPTRDHRCTSCHEPWQNLPPDAMPANSSAIAEAVSCENCHGAAASHVQAVKAGDAKSARPQKLTALSTEELSDFCGTCHRTWSQIAASGPHGVANVRFQPYRLANGWTITPSPKSTSSIGR